TPPPGSPTCRATGASWSGTSTPASTSSSTAPAAARTPSTTSSSVRGPAPRRSGPAGRGCRRAGATAAAARGRGPPAAPRGEAAPLAFQADAGGGRREVSVTHSVAPDGSVTFQVGPYDAGRDLVIDPVLDVSSYLGGTGDDYAYGVAVDGYGRAYVTGTTTS